MVVVVHADVPAPGSKPADSTDRPLTTCFGRLLAEMLFNRLSDDFGDGNPTLCSGTLHHSSLLFRELHLRANHVAC